MRFNFTTAEQYSKAWMFLMVIGVGFKYCRDEQWVEPVFDEFDDADERQDTFERLTAMLSH